MTKGRIFVFGSNLSGRHGKGAAREARISHGAVYGQGIGPQGRSYAIPTKDHDLWPLPLDVIKAFVNDFLLYAIGHSDQEFHVTRIGCGHAGYSDEEIAPLFSKAPDNCILPEGWRGYE